MRYYLSSYIANHVNGIQTANPTVTPNVLRAFGTDEPETGKLLHATKLDAQGNVLPLILKENLILDSGAWTLNQGNNKRPINKRVYAKYLQKYGNKFLFYMNLDEVFADEGNGEFDDKAIATNLVNQEYLEAQGLNPVPVIHSLDNSEIDFYVQRKTLKNHEYIAIGSTQARKKRNNMLVNAVDKLYNAGYKIHLFGIGNYNELNGLKVWSCDASSYVQHAKNKNVIFYSDIEGKEVMLSLLSHDKKGKENKDFIYSKEDNILEEYVNSVLNPLNFTLDDIFVNDTSRIIANAYYYTLLEKRLTDIQIKNGIVFDKW